MPIIASFMAKALAYTDAFSDYFVTVTGISAPFNAQCGGNSFVLNVAVTPCGVTLVDFLSRLIEVWIWATYAIVRPFLAGMLTT
jgi:hypothetical protein